MSLAVDPRLADAPAEMSDAETPWLTESRDDWRSVVPAWIRDALPSRGPITLEPIKEPHWGAVLRVTTPAGFELAAMIEWRQAEVVDGEAFFPAPRGSWQRRSNYSRNIWDRAAVDVGWPRRDDGRWLWTFHSLRHVFASWALHEAKIPIEDLSRLMGHSSTRVTQDIYIHVRDDMFDRFFRATRQLDSGQA
jgi:integrase